MIQGMVAVLLDLKLAASLLLAKDDSGHGGSAFGSKISCSGF